ncbi:hypothetical protein PIROE2DRAFT_15598 [Piromyces sp. E2]|nr:hypothetical protein PIROE2DRAFT_15598 [Piromyces sp. E2]|eukprot:OUM59005.1 hypothetical protein PIROE2DRAFT_15598 [Piromyces sp. E2]
MTKKQLKRKNALNKLDEYTYKLLKDLKNKSKTIKCNILINAINKTIEWIKNNPNISKEDSERRKMELEILSIPIFKFELKKVETYNTLSVKLKAVTV